MTADHQTPETAKTSRVQLPKLPWRILLMFSLTGLPTAALVIWLNALLGQAVQHHAATAVQVERTAGELLYYDEALTMSARMGAATGNPAWQQRYDALVPKLDAAIATARSLAPQSEFAAFVSDTGAANQQLIDLETRAFNLVKAGNRASAMEILLSADYARQKKIYADGNKAFRTALFSYVADMKARDIRNGETLLISTAVVFVIVCLMCLQFYLRLRSWSQMAQDVVTTFENENIASRARDQEMIDQQKALVDARQNEIEQAQKMREQDQALLRQQQEIAAARQADIARAELMHQKCAAFETMVTGLMQSVATNGRAMLQRTGELRTESNGAHTQAEAASQKVRNTFLTVEGMASSTEELSASIAEINQLVQESQRIAQSASGQARSTDDIVRGLSSAATRIGEISSLIIEITNRTNLLALNATIEAARAGEAGRGFAVVATEVKSLAGQTGNATQEITALIQEVQKSAAQTMDAVSKISATISDIDTRVGSVATAMQQQHGAVNDMAISAQKAHGYVQEFERLVGSTSKTVTQTSHFADGLEKNVTEVFDQFNDLQRQVKLFLQELRAA